MHTDMCTQQDQQTNKRRKSLGTKRFRDDICSEVENEDVLIKGYTGYKSLYSLLLFLFLMYSFTCSVFQK